MLVAFTSTATIAQIDAVLRETGGVIVDGPRTGGLYRLRLPEDAGDHTSGADQRLRAASDVIRLLLPETLTPR